jgi:hypothetical protein
MSDDTREAALQFFIEKIWPQVQSFSTEDVRGDPSNPDLVTGKRLILDLALTEDQKYPHRLQAHYTKLARASKRVR